MPPTAVSTETKPRDAMEKPTEEAIQKAQELAQGNDDEMARTVTSLRKSKPVHHRP